MRSAYALLVGSCLAAATAAGQGPVAGWPSPTPPGPRVAETPPAEPAPADLMPAQPPVVEEEPFWRWPQQWVTPVDWDGAVELGISGSDGNSEALSLRSGANLKRKTELHEFANDISYHKATAFGRETQHNAMFNTAYERFLGDSPWTYFAKGGVEYDEFRAFDIRLILNSGVGYRFIRTDTTKLVGRFGGGVSREVGSPDDAWKPEAMFGADYEWKIDDRQKVTAKVEYFPAWEDFGDYRIVSSAGWQVVLSQEHNLSLKLSVNDRYDSTPSGRLPNDLDYSLLLLWKI